MDVCIRSQAANSSVALTLALHSKRMIESTWTSLHTFRCTNIVFIVTTILFHRCFVKLRWKPAIYSTLYSTITNAMSRRMKKKKCKWVIVCGCTRIFSSLLDQGCNWNLVICRGCSHDLFEFFCFSFIIPEIELCSLFIYLIDDYHPVSNRAEKYYINEWKHMK